MGVLRRVFDAHGQLCASRPWEVIIATLTVILCTTSLTLFAASNKICDWNYSCERSHSDDVSRYSTVLHEVFFLSTSLLPVIPALTCPRPSEITNAILVMLSN